MKRQLRLERQLGRTGAGCAEILHKRRICRPPWSRRRSIRLLPMRAAVCHELGPPSVLHVEERPDPEPGPGKVAVAVEAAGVNFVDGLFVAGQYQMKPSLPFVPGSEVAGHVVAVGPDVDTVVVGDRVLASVGLGGFASRVVVSAASAIALPEGLDAARAATFTQSYSTCLFALRDRAQAAPGETVLVLGAGGGVGLAAISVARALGCRVIAAASTEESEIATRVLHDRALRGKVGHGTTEIAIATSSLRSRSATSANASRCSRQAKSVVGPS